MARYTVKELVADARAQDSVASQRLVYDWIALGLLDRPQRRGLGRGKGSVATWSENQRRLFLDLLAKRQRVSRLASLCSFVVWVWLLFGDGYVSRRQMRRALNTWGNSASTASRNTGQALAADLVADFASPNATQKDRRALSKALVDSLTAGEIEIARLGPLFEKVNLPGGDDRSDEISASVEIYLALLEARLLAYQHLGRIPDSTFEWARCAYVLTQHKRHETAPADLDDLVEWAPYDLLNLIGLAHTLPFDSPNKIENPSTWEEERLYAVPETALEAGGVLRTRLGVKAKTD